MWRPDPDISYLGRTTFRRDGRPFGIRQADRLQHLFVLCQTGVGKSTLLEGLALQDLAAGRGFALLDPHGDLVEKVAAAVPEREAHRVVYLNVPDPKQPFGYNPLRRVRDDKIPLAASGLLEAMRKLWPDAWGVRMEHVLRNSLYALLERQGSTLPDVLRLFAEKDFRKDVTRRIRNPVVRAYWEDEFENYPDRYRAEVVAPIQNKLGALLSDPTLHRILVSPENDLHIRALMDEGRVLLVNLARGRLGEDSATALGGLLLSTIGLAALSRADVEPGKRRPFFVYVDEFQAFTTLAFVSLMAELRKVGVGLTLATQTTTLIEPEVRHAVIANAGSLVCFRVGAEDAGLLERQFEPEADLQDLVRLPNHEAYLKFMIDGTPSRPFSARTLAPAARPILRCEIGGSGFRSDANAS